MAEGEIHKRLKHLALHWLKQKVTDLCANEVNFHNAYSIADAVGLNLKRKEVRVIEVKATRADFVRDKKLFGDKTSYFHHAHYSYIMCPCDIIQPVELPHGYGLLWVDEYENIEIVKKPIKNTARLKTLFDTTLKRTARALTNTHLFHEENKTNKDDTRGLYSKDSIVNLIAVTCPGCKKRNDQLITVNLKETQCNKRGCKTTIDLTKNKIKIITGFNKIFFNKIDSILKDGEE